jgi:ribosomal protein L7/L12
MIYKEKPMDQYDFDSLKARVAELEDKLKFVYRRLNIEYMEGDVAQAIDAKVRALLLQGNKIEAIKVYREVYNVGLAEAKRAVDAIEQTIA